MIGDSWVVVWLIGVTKGLETPNRPQKPCCMSVVWVAVKELKLSYCIGGTLLFTAYTHYGNLI